MFTAQCMRLFTMSCCLRGLFLFGLLLQRQQLRGSFLLALGQGVREAFQLLPGLVGLLGVLLFTQHALLL